MKYLSKSQYTRGIQCPKSLWLYRERKETQDPVTPNQQAIFDQGTEVGILAQKWLKGGVLIKAGHTEPERALQETAVAIASGITTIYEAAFLHDDVLVRADIITKNTDGSWNLIEAKSTTKLEESHLDDVAIQRYVIEGAGLKLERAYVAHLDPAYVRTGELDLHQLFASEDVTAEVMPLLATVAGNIAAMKKTAAAAEPPEVAIGPHCEKPHTCSFYGTCWAHVPDYSVFNLAGARMTKTLELWNSGVRTIADIPKKEKLTAYQTAQRLAAQTQKPIINDKGIRELLASLSYPQHFLDFEAVNPAVPPYDGLRPYQQLAFEASVHVRRERGAPLEHFEYMADGTKDPRKDLVNFLLDRIGPAGSVIAYNKSYEGGIIKGLATLIGRSAPDLLSMETRLWDLADAFRKGLYAHPDFKGSWSIKNVLPVLVPEMTYDGMAIADGTAAMRAYAKLMDPSTTPAERERIMAALRIYCGQDTHAMVRILDHVEATVGAAV